MKAMVLREITSLQHNEAPLSFTDMPEPVPGEGDVLLRVTRCGVCHTELDEIEGRTPPPQLPVILGHQVVGVVEESSSDFNRSGTTEVVTTGQRVGVAWIASACGHCPYCSSGQENLCPDFQATGR